MKWDEPEPDGAGERPTFLEWVLELIKNTLRPEPVLRDAAFDVEADDAGR